jgi:hypothetical protein
MGTRGSPHRWRAERGRDQGDGAGVGDLAVPGKAAVPCRHCWYSGLPGTLSAPQLQS